MMESSLDFTTYTLWSVYGTIAFFLLAILGFIFKWSFRFRLVGTTGFMIVLTVGLFALSLGLFERTEIPNAVRFNLVYDNGANQAVIAVPMDINQTQLEATLQQAAIDLYSYGRTAMGGDDKLTIRARIQIHEEGKTKPVYIGQVKRSLANREDSQPEVTIWEENLI